MSCLVPPCFLYFWSNLTSLYFLSSTSKTICSEFSDELLHSATFLHAARTAASVWLPVCSTFHETSWVDGPAHPPLSPPFHPCRESNPRTNVPGLWTAQVW